MKRWLRSVATSPIRLYQRFISPLKPPTCRFEPTCSHFAIGAIETHGVLKGTLIASWRILRCQPFTEPGLDPVPPPGRWRVTREEALGETAREQQSAEPDGSPGPE